MKKNVHKHNAFTFVELLMVILLLGIIITLTLPLLQNIKDDKELYRSYMKKAIHDVTDATSLVFLREKYLTDFKSATLGNLCVYYGCATAADKYNACGELGCNSPTGLRAVYNLLAVPGETCIGAACFTGTDGMPTNGAALPGIKVGNKTVMQFSYDPNPPANPTTFGNIYIDVNGSKKPNTGCQDRYKFTILLDRVVLDPDYDGDGNADTGCSYEITP